MESCATTRVRRFAAALVLLSLAGAAGAGPWSYHSAIDPATGKPRPSKAVSLNAKPSWATDYQWQWTYKVDTYAKEKSVVDDPTPESDTLSGFNAGSDKKSQHAKAGGSRADVYSEFDAALAGDRVTGDVWVWGDGGLGAAPAASSGSSKSDLQMRWVAKDAKNRIKLNTNWAITRAFGFGAANEPAKVNDPMDLRIWDLARDDWIFDWRLWEADCNVLDGSASFEGGTFSTSGTGPGSLTINAGHALIGGTGSITLVWDHAVITSALDDGIFDGLLPSIGTSALLPLFHIGDAEGNVFFDVDLGEETTAGYRWELGLGIENGAGEASVPTPGSTTLALIGIGVLAIRRKRN